MSSFYTHLNFPRSICFREEKISGFAPLLWPDEHLLSDYLQIAQLTSHIQDGEKLFAGRFLAPVALLGYAARSATKMTF